jgi:signal transduction histidine kinase/CheY-like chemotaxis protein
MSKGDRVHFPSIHVADLIKKLEAEAKLKEEVENRRRIELDLMKAKEKAEASTRAKGEFLANMSHEIRTPLNGVLGMAQILETSQLDSSQQEHLSVLMNSGNALLSVLNDILDFSKIEAGKLSVEEVSFDLHLCIEETCDLLIPKVQEKDLELIYRIKPGVPKYILGDPGRLRQILTNYFSNAIKFTFEGHVLLEVECLRLEDDTVDLRFSVIDTGVGIPEDKQSLIFEKFAQADTSTTRKFGGTGLGLSICQQLAHLMGGDVGLESREGVGSTFWLDMPAMINKKENVVVSKQAQEPLQSCRILYVDSHTLNQKVFEEHFHGTNAEVTLCASAMEAFKVLGNSMLAEEPYDILVTEHRMNKHSGLTLMESIHKRFPDMLLRSVMLTGTPEKGEAQQMRNAGFHAYVPKPARRDILRKIVSMLLGTESSNLSETFLTRHSIREMEEGQQQKGKEEEQIQLKVLLAEDNLINQKVAIKMLGKIGVDVDVATDGKIAIEKFTSGDYELIIMDCMMPNMDGYAATRQIRSSNHERAKDIPIVAMTAHAMEGSREKCLDAGMTDFISKPFKFDALKEILRKYAQPFS